MGIVVPVFVGQFLHQIVTGGIDTVDLGGAFADSLLKRAPIDVGNGRREEDRMGHAGAWQFRGLLDTPLDRRVRDVGDFG